MAQTKITIQGLDEALRWADKAPKNCLDATRAALREASRVEVRKLKQRIPKRWQKLVKYSVIKTQDGKLRAYLGMFNRKETQGHQPRKGRPTFDWYKAYWANYGTLARRWEYHDFDRPVKADKDRRNDEGQNPQLFYEKAAGPFTQEFTEAYQQAFAKQQAKLMER